jgi:hypothetical protein
MPDNNNRIVKRDMFDALAPAELNIAKFQPPSANPAPQTDPNTPPPPPNLERIQQEVAQKSAQERTDALFDLLTQLITQTCKDEIDRQSIVAALSSLRADVSNIQAILSRHNLS